MPEIEAVLWERVRILEARVAALERRQDAAPERVSPAGAFGVLAFCKSNEPLEPEGSAEFSLYEESATGALIDTGVDATVYAPPYLHEPLTLGADKWGILLRLIKRLWWIGGDCPE